MLNKVQSFFSRVWQGLTKAKNRVCEFLKFDIWTPECWFEPKSADAPEKELEESPEIEPEIEESKPTEDTAEQKILKFLAPIPMSEFQWKSYQLETDSKVMYFPVNHPVTTQHLVTFNSIRSQFELQSPMIRDLFLIQGVKLVQISPYKIMVEIADLFYWEDLESKISAVIIEYLTGQEVA